MVQALQESIDLRKAQYEKRGQVISDYEASEAVNNLCEYFKILNEWDMKRKAQEEASEKEAES